ncbi:hypothetical protein GGR44_001360 [Sphingobium fontiphilum]|uniref:Carboxypeptidase regulatory-like domain-containing protein n=1 Tax=Sphingobium fontiphilum TaxID=944425 RepID=A0A7W6DEL8_9SPHN|nr:carboxypeptidase-like regulatory domain-containing protein [Sphingobium fontiphilum]MBB3981713.1 hypothetical protein [Sphingobium fontiphilum]
MVRPVQAARRAWLWLLVALLGLFAPCPASAQLRTDPDDAMLFDARIGAMQIGQGIRAFNTPAGLCLDFRDVIDTLQVAITVSPDGQRAEGWAFDEQRHILIDRARGDVRFGGQYAALKADTIWESRSGWCVRAEDLGLWLGVDFVADDANAILTVTAQGGLPIEAAMKRAEAAYRLKEGAVAPREALPEVALPYRLWRTPSIDVGAALAADRAVDGAVTRRARYELFAAGELGYLSADMRLASDEAGMPQSMRLKLYRASAQRALLGPLHASEFALGDVISPSTGLVALATPGRGATVTNRPLGMAARYDQVSFVGDLPQGWDVELYRNGELLGSVTDGATGRYEFQDVDLRSGVNAFDIVRYGPQGQVKRERRSYNIAGQTPGPGELWWYGAVVQDRHDLIRFSGSPDLAPGSAPARSGWRSDIGFEYGLGKGTSLSIAAHRHPLPGGKVGNFAEAAARASMLGMLTEFSIAQAQGGGRAVRAYAIGELLKTSFTIEAIRNHGMASERLDARQRAVTAVALDRQVRMAGLIMPLHFDLRSTISRSDKMLQAQARASIATRTLSASASLGWQRVTPLGGSGRSEATASLLFNSRFGALRLRGEADWALLPRPRMIGAAATASRSLGQSGEAQATLGYANRDRYAYAGLSYTRDLGFASVTGNAQADTRGAFSLGLALQFSIGANGQGRFGRIGSGARAASGSIAVSAYRDTNGDGARQPNEPLIAAPGLLVNDVPIATCKSRGDTARKHGKPCDPVALIEGLEPAVPVRVSLDEGAIADPFEVASGKGISAVPRAGVATPVELGIVGTATLEGSLVIDGREAPGEALQLVDAKGVVAYSIRTEFDGFFSFERVRYGSYDLRLARSRKTLVAQPITVGANQPTIRLGLLEASSDAARLAIK